MSRFAAEAVAAGGLSESFGYFGQSAIYSPPKDPDVSLTIILSPEERRVETNSGGRIVTRTMVGTITNDPDSVYGGVAEPNEAATVTISNEEWAIESVSKPESGWALRLVRPEVTEQARPGYRLEMT